jgi:hypothetical protein
MLFGGRDIPFFQRWVPKSYGRVEPIWRGLPRKVEGDFARFCWMDVWCFSLLAGFLIVRLLLSLCMYVLMYASMQTRSGKPSRRVRIKERGPPLRRDIQIFSLQDGIIRDTFVQPRMCGPYVFLGSTRK